MLNKWEDIKVRWRGNVLTGHQRLGDSGIRDGEVFDIGTEEVEDTTEKERREAFTSGKANEGQKLEKAQAKETE